MKVWRRGMVEVEGGCVTKEEDSRGKMVSDGKGVGKGVEGDEGWRRAGLIIDEK